MKRLTYISKSIYPISDEEMQTIGAISQYNNRRADIHGVLMYAHGLFFQILEGPKVAVDQLYAKIQRDPRHTEVLCLKNEENISERVFLEWSMKTIRLESENDIFIKPLKMLLDNIIESYSVLKIYTQPTIFNLINSGINPLTIEPKVSQKIILFSDIQAFSTLVEKIPIENVMALVNQYFSLCSRIIHQHGGEVSKFIGDCVMSHFDAEHSDQAISAALAILNELQQWREKAADNHLNKILYAGIGIAQGQVIQCNMGSELKKDYTLLGDAVNIASRLESLTREYAYDLIFTDSIKHTLTKNWNCIDLGLCYPKGKEEPVQIYSIDHPSVYASMSKISIHQQIKQYLIKNQLV
jgi:class 3 adenylate cyclase